MQPGRNRIYSCPNCTQKVIVGSAASGNNIGAVIYSDGQQICPMMPKYPTETKCEKCGTIFEFNQQTLLKDTEDLNEKIELAELNRNLGNFETCK